jgi:hypothetical protein
LQTTERRTAPPSIVNPVRRSSFVTANSFF